MEKFSSSSHLFGNNAVFAEELYAKYLDNPASVDSDWAKYFASLGDRQEDVKQAVIGASWKPYGNRVIGVQLEEDLKKIKANDSTFDASLIVRSIRSVSLIDAFRTYGHTNVMLDPIGIVMPKYHPELDYRSHGLMEEDLKEEVCLGGMLGIDRVPLQDLIHYLKATYSGRVGAEFVHIEDCEERSWIQHMLESSAGVVSISKEEKLSALENIMRAQLFENYLHTKFPGTKRFSVEGCESMIASIKAIVEESVDYGIEECVLGMAHRGRLNTLVNVMQKPFRSMFAEFRGELAFPEDIGVPGDVKYHAGASKDIEVKGKKVHMSLLPNPSHLEVVNAVAMGKVRAKQDLRNDVSRNNVLGILLHGDAAFSGQGSVMEALSLSQLKIYHTGGTVHIITNNQIGFTTNTEDSRSTLYCTDIAKFISAPIFHVNADDADAVVYVSKLAAQYRAKFKKDVIIDVVGYRKYGHNEGDEPFFTQPLLYNKIKNKANPAEIYSERLINEGVISKALYESNKMEFKTVLDMEFEASKTYKAEEADWLKGDWSNFSRPSVNREEPVTGVELKTLKSLGGVLSKCPETFKVNPKIARILEAKAEMIVSGENLDWSAGEGLAFATLLNEGFGVRITGQDVERGTFSHRHAVVVDQENQDEYTFLNNIPGAAAKIEINNSNLSEFGVLGFEYGYSFTHPEKLTIWEAQFGDFANGAQVIIDQYIVSGEAKWLRMSGLVMLLPHGYEGQGPEHSSARLERFLQLCADDNIQVVNCTTPASIFHVLRRQMHNNFRKPLIVMSPKSLLRHKLAVSDLSEFDKGTKFKPVIDDTKGLMPDSVKKVILCSGKVYYDLYEERENRSVKDVAIVRLEQLYPFPKSQIQEILSKYKNAKVVWCQEEHENMGAYNFVRSKLDALLAGIGNKNPLIYAGRSESASPAVGYMKLHTIELKKFLEKAFSN